MRPPRRTLQPIGQQLTEQAAAAMTPTTSVPVTGRVRTRPLPGVIVLPAQAQIVEGMS